jgi:hypothetical protein
MLNAARLPQFQESQRTMGRLSSDEWRNFFENGLRPSLESIHYDEDAIFNVDETSFFKNFVTTHGGRKVYVKKWMKNAPCP